jgi:hypothetical protein
MKKNDKWNRSLKNSVDIPSLMYECMRGAYEPEEKDWGSIGMNNKQRLVRQRSLMLRRSA